MRNTAVLFLLILFVSIYSDRALSAISAADNPGRDSGLRRVLLPLLLDYSRTNKSESSSSGFSDYQMPAKDKIDRDPGLQAILVSSLFNDMKLTKTSSSSSEALEKSKELITEGKYDEALSVLSPYISDPLKYPDVVADYLSILVWDHRIDEAINMYKSLPEEFPGYGYLQRNMAKAYYDRQDFQMALSLYDASLKQDPMDEEAQKGLVYSLIRNGDFNRADDYLEVFLSRSPGSLTLDLAKFYLLLWQDRYVEAVELFHELEQIEEIDKEFIYKSRDDLIVSLPDTKKQLMESDLKNAGREFTTDFILLLILKRDFKTAVTTFEASELAVDLLQDYLLGWIAWAYFKTGDTVTAKKYFNKILSDKPDYIRAKIGLAYCLAKDGQGERAIQILDSMLSTDPKNTEMMFARAYALEKTQRFWMAVREYDRIIGVTRENPVAERLRLRALSDLGASTHALARARKNFPHDSMFLEGIVADMLVDRIRWKEYSEAIDMFHSGMEDNLRTRYDHLVALVENRDMNEAIAAYEKMLKEGTQPPYWLMEYIAEAYMYMHQPYKALELYDRVLEERQTFRSRMGKFYALQEIREFDKARNVLNDLDEDIPEVLRAGRKIKPNWQKLDTVLARGWSLIYEDRFQEAEDYFMDLYEKAPANTGIRTGLAHSYLWRGWPRKALREFKINSTLDPKNVKNNIGKILALNTLAFKKEARKEAQALTNNHEKDIFVKDLNRRLRLEELREILTDVAVEYDDEGFEEVSVSTRISQPVSLRSKLFGFLFWQRSSDPSQSSYFRRSGLGIDHTFNNRWHLIQRFSLNYNDGDDFGSFTLFDFTPDDYWSLGLSYDSFTTDIPMRARVFDIEADRLNAALKYRESEKRGYAMSYSCMRFSDDNDRDEWMIGYEQGLYEKNNWKMKLFLDFYASANSRDDVPYFNPDNDFSISAAHLTEHTLMKRYEEAFIQRLYLSLGVYDQSGFSGRATGAVRYEHSIDFSDVHSLLYGSNLSMKAFDGERVTGYGFYLMWKLLF